MIHDSVFSKYDGFQKNQLSITNALKDMFQVYTNVQHIVLNKHLIQWKQEQIQAGNAEMVNVDKFNRIQKWCEQLVDIICTMIQNIKKLLESCKKLGQSLNSREREILLLSTKEALTTLMNDTVLVEIQPEQVRVERSMK